MLTRNKKHCTEVQVGSHELTSVLPFMFYTVYYVLNPARLITEEYIRSESTTSVGKNTTMANMESHSKISASSFKYKMQSF